MNKISLVNIIDQHIVEYIKTKFELHFKLWLEVDQHPYVIIGPILRNETLVLTTLVQVNLLQDQVSLSLVDPTTEDVNKMSFQFCDPQFPENVYEAINSWTDSWELWYDLYNESIRKQD